MLAAEAWAAVVRQHGGGTVTESAPVKEAGTEDSANGGTTDVSAPTPTVGLRDGEICLGILSNDSDMCVYAPLQAMREIEKRGHAAPGESGSVVESSLLSGCGWVPIDSICLCDDSLDGIDSILLRAVFGAE